MSAIRASIAVLVVEDEALLRMYAVDVLEDAGYEVLEAADAEQALAKLDARPDVGIMFTDINMPGCMDGFELAREVSRRRPDVRLVLTSGRMSPPDEEFPEICAFVRKPYTAERLTSLFGNVIP